MIPGLKDSMEKVWVGKEHDISEALKEGQRAGTWWESVTEGGHCLRDGWSPKGNTRNIDRCPKSDEELEVAGS
jgi:hypothetical protein